MIYHIRLDDACEKRDIKRWNRIEALLDKYNIKPLVGIIPHCEDPMMDQYVIDELFWDKAKEWVAKGWVVAMHGYAHVFENQNGGINPVNKRSEFAGVPLERQKDKIRRGIEIFHMHNIVPQVFFAPAHTFDRNTLTALSEESNIRIISDTIANKPYKRWNFIFIPQQSGHVRKLPLNTVTFCYHPNTMEDNDFNSLERFIQVHLNAFQPFEAIETNRGYGIIDRILQFVYFIRRK